MRLQCDAGQNCTGGTINSKESIVPTVLRIGPFRFFFYAGDGLERPHVHVERDRGECKFWLDPVSLARNEGFRQRELQRIYTLIVEHQQELLESWHEFFGDNGSGDEGLVERPHSHG